MKKLFTISFLLLSACAKFEIPKDPRTVHGVDPAFIPYVETYLFFKKIYRNQDQLNYDIPIGFTNLPGDVVGMCTRWPEGYRQITIDREYWESSTTTDDERTSLIAHELGHCDLNMGHSDDPYSIMYEYNGGWLNFPELFNPDISHYHKAGDACVEDIK